LKTRIEVRHADGQQNAFIFFQCTYFFSNYKTLMKSEVKNPFILQVEKEKTHKTIIRFTLFDNNFLREIYGVIIDQKRKKRVDLIYHSFRFE